jgi:hypothetical protein
MNIEGLEYKHVICARLLGVGSLICLVQGNGSDDDLACGAASVREDIAECLQSVLRWSPSLNSMLALAMV